MITAILLLICLQTPDNVDFSNFSRPTSARIDFGNFPARQVSPKPLEKPVSTPKIFTATDKFGVAHRAKTQDVLDKIIAHENAKEFWDKDKYGKVWHASRKEDVDRIIYYENHKYDYLKNFGNRLMDMIEPKNVNTNPYYLKDKFGKVWYSMNKEDVYRIVNSENKRYEYLKQHPEVVNQGPKSIVYESKLEYSPIITRQIPYWGAPVCVGST